MNHLTTPRQLPQWAHLFALSPLVAAMIGCASGPDYVRPESLSLTESATVAPAARTVGSPVVDGGLQQFAYAPVPGEWWKELQADKLIRLIDQALVASRALAAAKATLKQAQHNYAASSGATEIPQVNAKLGAQRLGVNNAAAGLPDGERSYDLYNATVAVSYDLDLAGGNRRALEALTAQAHYQSYQLEGTRLTLAANLVGGYLVGVCVAAFQALPQLDPAWRLALVTGFLGALTTFSSFSAEVVALLQQERYLLALGWSTLHLPGSLLMTVLGIKSTTLFIAYCAR